MYMYICIIIYIYMYIKYQHAQMPTSIYHIYLHMIYMIYMYIYIYMYIKWYIYMIYMIYCTYIVTCTSNISTRRCRQESKKSFFTHLEKRIPNTQSIFCRSVILCFLPMTGLLFCVFGLLVRFVFCLHDRITDLFFAGLLFCYSVFFPYDWCVILIFLPT